MGMDTNSSRKVLSLDTSSPRGSVALLQGCNVIAESRLFSLQTHSVRLLRSIQFLLECADWRLRDLRLVCAGIGPGSFTGIRIGLSTALGLAQTLDLPFAGISGLDALAAQACCPEGRIGAVMDAQRKQVYYAEYVREMGQIKAVKRPRLCDPEELGRQLGGDCIYLAGDGAARYAAELGIRTADWPRLATSDLYLAAAVGRLGLVRRRTWRSGEDLRADALYIRPPDALIKKRDAKERLFSPSRC